MAAAFGLALFQTISYKRRKQQNDMDSSIFIKFLINCCSTMGTVLFGSAVILTIYIYFLYKTQQTVQVLPPFDELKLIKWFLILAFVLKVSNFFHFKWILQKNSRYQNTFKFKAVKFGQHISQQIDCDIFFIDWERPRVFEHQITLKSTNNLDTPSICSSVRVAMQKSRPF